ncbi:FAD-binding domain-containing protein [Durotheca rogersii]|uniref:FAD-binding domain-containing protein n=1 Tax=Durotheca rogersii TaxID=419775 RepID=UPI002220932D|nr:FAD-binding domain-containing protein [Durotheca rogersii]KAI5863941.1 FAD-binding domain-containing protein [Durotheca rogersii]
MKSNFPLALLGTCLPGVAAAAAAYNVSAFPPNSIQLTEADIGDFSSIRFGDDTDGTPLDVDESECKVFPGDPAWPAAEEWARLNATLGGVLLRPTPSAAVCYPGPDYDPERCQFLVSSASSSHYWLDEPLVALTEWAQGATCALSLAPEGNCTRGGFPEYVVNATTARHIQTAVNFARNKNIRLIIKNTGHDFGGRSVGAGALSVWTHYIKTTEFLPAYEVGEYSGMAVHVGAGIESWEEHNLMARYNVTILAPGCGTVGGAGGWMSGGGHTTVSSRFGLGADQVLALGVVTAAGRFVVADPYTNSDLFFALRGGGGGTYGVVTSAVMKAHPRVTVTGSSLAIVLGNGTSAPGGQLVVADADTFWRAVGAYYRFAAQVLDAGGFCFSYIYPAAGGGFLFTTLTQLVGGEWTQEAAATFARPLYAALRAAGVAEAADPAPGQFSSAAYGTARAVAVGPSPGNTRYRSRLLPRENWDDDARWARTMAAVRTATEAGFDNGFYFHGTLASPTEDVAGWPGRASAVNPAWRRNRMHAMLMDQAPAQSVERDAMMQDYMDLLRAASPGAGAYMNEGDPGEPAWQQAFYGSHYARLLAIKRARDPWGAFWAPTTVGSEGWAVRPAAGAGDGAGAYAGSQNGRLCRTGA